MNKVSLGQRKVWYLVIVWFIFAMLNQFTSILAGNHSSVDVVRLILTLVLMYYLYQGNNLARIIALILFILTIIFALFLSFGYPDLLVKLLSLALVIWAGINIYYLGFSPDVKKFFKETNK
ncbi:MAG TPA: hypothetical protein VF209_04620 [Patescibacteria group bacterium]